MTEHDDLIRRLHAFSDAPVDEGLAERHLAAMAGTIAPRPIARPRGRLVVAGALVTGSLVGSATIAGAATGALPSAVQDAAHTVMAKVGVEVPKSKAAEAKAKAKAARAKAKAQANGNDGAPGVERFTGEGTTSCTNVDGTPFTGTHGDYVSGHPDDPATADVNEREVAAQSQCGKPIQAGGPDGTTGKPADTGKPDTAGKSGERTPPSTGKPATTGKPDASGKTSERKPTTTTTTVAED